MNWFDHDILSWLNAFARSSRTFDVIVAYVGTSNALKGGLATVVLLWFWFGGSVQEQRRNREIIVATAVAASVAVIAGRLLAAGLPYRIRPVHNPELSFVAPYGYPEGLLRGWSAFPSDHAMIFGAIAMGLCYLSRRLGVVALAYTVVVILAPRVYLGMHHPTDILFGLALGIGFAALANLMPVRRRMAGLPLRWAAAHPRSFYAVAFLGAMQVATMLDGPREIVREAVMMIRTRQAGAVESVAGPRPAPVTPVNEPRREAETARPRFPGEAALLPAAPVKLPMPLNPGATALR